MKVNTIAIFANASKPEVYPLLNEMEEFFKKEGVKAFLVNLSSSVADNDIVPPKVDLAVSLGGDGTALTCADILKGTGTPIMAVKLGTFGYITEISGNEYKRVFREYVEGEVGVFEKMMLDVSVARKNETVFKSSALNEITISSCNHGKMAYINLFIDDVLAANLKADGLILATPTGSTAYNLSAGGPILDSTFDSILVNAICPFAMSVRPLVVNGNTKVSIMLPSQRTELKVMADGHYSFDLHEGDEIFVERSTFRAPFVQNKERKFIDVLRDKLGWAGGFNA